MNKKTGCKNNTDAITKEALDAQKEKKNRKRFFSVFQEAQPCLSRKHNRASRGSKTVTLAKEKKQKTCFVFPFLRGTAVTLAKVKTCLSLKQNRDSCESKKEHIFS